MHAAKNCCGALASTICVLMMCSLAPPMAAANGNFKVAVYVPVKTVQQMADRQYLQSSWSTIHRQLKVDKVYLETYRSQVLADEASLETIKKFFRDQGVEVAGGLALTAADSRTFETFCYTDPQAREYVKRAMELTARHFDEIILDDFFFNMTKRDSDIAAKGNRSWTQFRLELMNEVSQNVILKPARAVNPKVKVIIKYPNWYEHFQGLGYDLENQPRIFDGLYTGTETRDPVVTDQNLQQYESYEILRYFENIKPGGNGGGWVDTFSVLYVDRYAEQLWNTVFAKPREVMLFNWDLLLRPIDPGDRAAWKDLKTSFDFDRMLASAGSGQATMARVAGYSLEKVDAIAGRLGTPIGLKSYKPYHSTGEDFLHNYLGMVGIPIDLHPSFPSDADVVLLTEAAKADAGIVEKIKAHLRGGHTVVITSGLLRALQGKGIEDIVELEYTDRKVAIRDYLAGFGAGSGSSVGAAENKDVVIPQIQFLTNDAWPLVRGIANGRGFPLLLMDRYSKGTLYVITIPDNFNDLYSLPPAALSRIKDYILGDFPVRIDGPAQIALFAYDNNTFIVESYLPTETKVTVSVAGGATRLRDLSSGSLVQRATSAPDARAPMAAGPERSTFTVGLKPHSYVAFAAEK